MLTTSKKVLIFSLAYHPMVGGAEIAVKEITDRIPDIEFDMITLRFDKTHKKEEKIGNVNIYRIGGGFRYISKILFVPQAALFALKLHRKNKYNAFWAIMTNMLFPITLMRLFGNRTPYISTLQDGDPFEYVFRRLRIRIFLPLLKYGFRHASKVQTISNFLADWAWRMGYTGNSCVIPNGVDVEKFANKNVLSLASDKGDITLITTSRLVEKNAVGDIIDALKFLPESVSLKILGTGALEQVLRSRVISLKLENRVKFLGFISPQEIPVYLHASDIFVRPSLSEGMGNSFIEAMAAGLPVIGTPVGGIPDFLKDPSTSSGQVATGLFCEVNDPKSIADKVMEYVNNPELTSKIVKNAKDMVVKKYDWNLIASEMKSRVFDKV
ncbi:MAG: glycosyltransferase family 4 protein [Patescibacteria group bacterium]|nr:glycosyltransferase family 4 protein [Patescibacteria group bacterium]